METSHLEICGLRCHFFIMSGCEPLCNSLHLPHKKFSDVMLNLEYLTDFQKHLKEW